MPEDIIVQVGQQDAINVISSVSQNAGPLADIATDIDTTNRANRTFLMYNSSTGKYEHVDAAQIVDLSDNVDDESYDAGNF
jgi:hypothetical protein